MDNGWTIIYRNESLSSKSRFKRVSGVNTSWHGAKLIGERFVYLYPTFDVYTWPTREREENNFRCVALRFAQSKITSEMFTDRVNQLYHAHGEKIQESGMLFDGIEIPTEDEIRASCEMCFPK